jgi:hypothetical protein
MRENGIPWREVAEILGIGVGTAVRAYNGEREKAAQAPMAERAVCACGCGQTFVKKGPRSKFAKGHHGRAWTANAASQEVAMDRQKQEIEMAADLASALCSKFSRSFDEWLRNRGDADRDRMGADLNTVAESIIVLRNEIIDLTPLSKDWVFRVRVINGILDGLDERREVLLEYPVEMSRDFEVIAESLPACLIDSQRKETIH